jgi:DNA-binding transcriptional LysR family regulator
LHPGLRLDLVVNNSFLNLTRREADVAIRGSNSPPENLVGRRVGNIQTAVYASAEYLKARGRKRDEADLDWVGYDDSLSHLLAAKWMSQEVAPERVALRVDSLVAMADAVAAGLGAGWLLCPLAQSRRGLRQLRPPPRDMETQIWVLTHPDLKRVARIRALTDFLHEHLSVDPRLRHG